MRTKGKWGEHRMWEAPVFNRWSQMIQRCHSPTHGAYKNYGGRGIRVCKRWQSFRNFYEDMGEPPKGLSLERINNDKGYSPSNCKWATTLEQSRNKRRSIRILGMTLDEASEKYGLKKGCISKRMRLGWDDKKTLNTPSIRGQKT